MALSRNISTSNMPRQAVDYTEFLEFDRSQLQQEQTRTTKLIEDFLKGGAPSNEAVQAVLEVCEKKDNRKRVVDNLPVHIINNQPSTNTEEFNATIVSFLKKYPEISERIKKEMSGKEIFLMAADANNYGRNTLAAANIKIVQNNKEIFIAVFKGEDPKEATIENELRELLDRNKVGNSVVEGHQYQASSSILSDWKEFLNEQPIPSANLFYYAVRKFPTSSEFYLNHNSTANEGKNLDKAIKILNENLPESITKTDSTLKFIRSGNEINILYVDAQGNRRVLKPDGSVELNGKRIE